MKQLFTERLKRYQAAIALKTPDRIPIAPGVNYFAEVYSGVSKYEYIYDSKKWIEADRRFLQDFPEFDVLRTTRMWAPLHDAVGYNLYKMPGRDLPPQVQFQFVEGERMKADEYDLLINNPTEFLFDRVLPRALNEFGQQGSFRSHMAFLKGGMAFMMTADLFRKRYQVLETEYGMPQAAAGIMLAPFDALADGLRGLNGIMMDIFRKPDKVLEACDAIVPYIVNNALAAADPLRRYPVFMPLHRGCSPFLSPEQFDTFYWPSLKKAMLLLIGAGYTIRALLEGDWGLNWHHIREIPKGKVLCDIDNQGNIFKAKDEIGDHQCLSGGIPDSMFILGSPDEIRERVKLLCTTVGKDGGYIVNGGCHIPYDAKPENVRAMADAVLEYGRYGDTTHYELQVNPAPPPGWQPPEITTGIPWEEKLRDLGGVTGDGLLIAQNWGMLERVALSWLWQWIW